MMLFAASTAKAQSSPPPDQAEQVRMLLERVQRLERRLAEMETKLAAASAPLELAANVPAAPKPELAEAAPSPGPGHQHEGRDEQTAVRQMETHYPSLQIRGFGDVDFSATDQQGATSGFNLGQLDLHMSSPLSRKVSYFGEMTFNAQPTGYTVEVERSIIRYDYNDYFKISFGRYHTPIGYWNTAFHHGAWLQTSISRPDDAGDNNDNRAWVANLYSRPVKLYGLQMGVSVYRDKITLANTLPNGNNFREWISAAHLVWSKESPEFLAEFANVNHRNILTNFVTNSQAFYAQVGYRLPWLERTLKPYYRFEHTHTSLSEQVFTNQDLVGSIIGLRYDITNYAAFKGEYRNSKRLPTDPRVNGVFFQTDFTF